MPTTLEKPRTATVTVKLDALHRDRLKSLATAKKRTSHYLMKEAIELYLESEEAEQKAIQEAAASLAHYQKTGLHITLDEMKQWANNLKTNRNSQLPACHS